MTESMPLMRSRLEAAKIGNEKFFEENSLDDVMHRLWRGPTAESATPIRI